MIAVSSSSTTFVSGQESKIEVYESKSETEIIVPVTIDLITCLKEGVSTISLEVLRQVDQLGSKLRTIDQVNNHLKQKGRVREILSESVIVLASKNIDITTLIPNTALFEKSLANGTRDQIASLFAPKMKIVPSQEETSTASPSSVKGSDRQFVERHQDPSFQNMGSLPLDTVASIAATSLDSRMRVSVSSVSVPKTKISLADASRSQVKLSISYPGPAKDLNGCKVRITVRSKNVESQVLTFNPSIPTILETSRVPYRPPVITGGFNTFGKANVSITQVDDLADTLTVVMRAIKDYTLPSTGFETVADKIACKKGETVSLTINTPYPCIVRAHPSAGDVVSPVFGSAVLGNVRRGVERFSSTTGSFIIAVNSSNGISIDFATSDLKVNAVLLRRIDLRSGTQTTLTTGPVTASTINGFIDTGVEDLARVKYEADLYRSNGDVVRSVATSEIVTRIEPRDIVGADITVTPINTGNQIVKISIVPSVKQNDVNFLIDYIKNLGLETAFQTDLESLRKSLLNCVKFDVIRYDLQTGEAKYIGQTSSTIDDDITDVKISSNFLYVFEAFVRSPSQLTDVINDRSNRPVGVSPKITRLGLHITKADVDKIHTQTTALSDSRRFFSRSNFETGTMPSQSATDGFADGRTGDIFLSRVTVSPTLPAVTSVSVQKSRDMPVILWRMTGDIRLIDRFVVTGQSSGATWVVSPAGVTGTSAYLQVTDLIPHTLPRYVMYSVYPVYLDGKIGQSVASSMTLLENTRVI